MILSKLPEEIQRSIWSYLYPVDNLYNKYINHASLGTSVNNMFLTENYCYRCGEPNLVSNCRFFKLIVIMECKKCKYTSIYNDICCIDRDLDYWL